MNSEIRQFLDKPLPTNVGWAQVFGSMLLALLAVQFITGILLSFVYAPSPLSAHESVRYITRELPGGAWLRGVHSWGSSLIIIVIWLHLIRTFLFAAYKYPRQTLWISGVLLLLCMLAFAQTGFLLPYDQHAYWGTAVTIRIVGTAPLLGPFLAQLLQGGETVGALTLSRFYSIHVILLPIATTLLVILHLLLLRRFGITDPWARVGAEGSRTVPFYPYQMSRDATGMFVILVILFLAAAMLPPDIGSIADPADNRFVPRPDWYFLFLFQLLHYFEGPLEVVGTFILPTLGIIVLFLIPWIDRSKERSLRKRPYAVGGAILAVLLWSGLTYVAVQQTPRPSNSLKAAGMEPSRSERIKRPAEIGGLVVIKQHCLECHSLTILGSKPKLEMLARNHFPAGGPWLHEHLSKQGRSTQLAEREIEEVVSTLRVLTARSPQYLYTIPPEVRLGAHMFYQHSCIDCHSIDGQGGKGEDVEKGPDLTLRRLRKKEWHSQHIKDPRSLVPDSKMPPFLHFEEAEYNALAEYILYLHRP